MISSNQTSRNKTERKLTVADSAQTQHIVLQEDINAVKAAINRVDDLTSLMMTQLSQWSLCPVVNSLVGLSGIDKVAAMALLSELGDISRFESPRQLMSYLGLTPVSTAAAIVVGKGEYAHTPSFRKAMSLIALIPETRLAPKHPQQVQLIYLCPCE